ncbi:hypothetical protein HHK36_012638 [Tetracentron sinense]|uniref:Uncharacterized protein n=1 Tax=Tetracentron sinense TaxID=13715 RepID=A0A834ZFN6_TETSI|nr:hypothetical protein HHK36_012638 [Tetracentron sinense]
MGDLYKKLEVKDILTIFGYNHFRLQAVELMPLSFSSPFLPSNPGASFKLILPLFSISRRQEIRSASLPSSGAHSSSSTTPLQLHVFTGDNSVWRSLRQIPSHLFPLLSLGDLGFTAKILLAVESPLQPASPSPAIFLSGER